MHRGRIKRVTVMLPDDLHVNLKVYAAFSQSTLQQLILTAIIQHMSANSNPGNTDNQH